MAKVHQVADEFVYFRKTIEDMRLRSLDLMKEGRNIQSHFTRMMREYSDWEDRLKALDEQVDKLASETGLTTKEIHSEIAIPQTLTKSESVIDSVFDDITPNAPKEEPVSILDDLLDM